MLESRELRCHWNNKSRHQLGAATFCLSVLKIENIIKEFGAERKGTKSDTLADGVLKTGNKELARKLEGKRIILSHSNKALYLTSLPIDVLMQIPLPQNIESMIQASASSNDSLAAVMGKNPEPTQEAKLAYATKEFFRQIAAFLKLVYANQQGDMYIYEVVIEPQTQEVVLQFLNGGESLTGNIKDEDFVVTFGIQKEIK